MTAEWKYVFNGFDRDELYDLRRDPYEMINRADDPAYTAKGGYEQTWAFSQPCEAKLKAALKQLGEKVRHKS